MNNTQRVINLILLSVATVLSLVIIINWSKNVRTWNAAIKPDSVGKYTRTIAYYDSLQTDTQHKIPESNPRDKL